MAEQATKIGAFYRFVTLRDPPAVQHRITQLAQAHGLRGTTLVASEGINGTLSGAPDDIDAFFAELGADPRFEGILPRWSWADTHPFHRLKVRLKSEIVSLGVPGIDPNRRVGTYVDPQRWNELIDDPEVVVIDVRNDYEIRIGSFEGAVDPETTRFRDFPAWVEAHPELAEKRIAMFCTGGIRCEKATSYMLEQGIEQVYHLQGGILRYLAEVPPEQSRWRGQCFVFDERVSVGHGLSPGGLQNCPGCRQPLTPEAMHHAAYEPGVRCGNCGPVDEDTLARHRERARQERLARSRGTVHVGARVER